LGVIATTATPANAASSFGFSFGGPGIGFNYYDGPRYYRSCYDYYRPANCYPRYTRRYYDYPPRYYRDRDYWYGDRYYYR
jgi:hypothetical protein